MSKYYFIIFRDNNNCANFEIIASKIADYRKKGSIIKYNYNKYLKYGKGYKSVYEIIQKDYSSYCVFRGDFSTLEEVKLKLDELTEFYQSKFLSNNNT